MTYRAALIGCGRIGSEWADDHGAAASGVGTHAAAYRAHPNVELVAVCDADRAKAERCARRWNVAARYTDYQELLGRERPEVVSVCTPDSTHYAIIRAALLAESVRAILAEKPLALVLAQANELVALARQRSVLLAVNYSRRYAAEHVRLRDFLRGGGIGAVRLVRGLYTKGTLHNGTHWFDLVRFLVSEVRGVSARDRLREGGEDPTLDVQLHCDGGMVAELHGCSAHDLTIFEMDLVGNSGRVRVIDSGAVMEFFEVVEGRPYAGYRVPVLKQRTSGGLHDMMLHAVADLIHCLDTGASPRCSGDDGVEALRIAAAARLAADTGTVIELRHQ